MKYRIERTFSANVLFEASIEVNGDTYFVIYGKHINGFYCCIPGWNWGCEMSEPNSMPYNRDKLIACGATDEVAQTLAEAIQFMIRVPSISFYTSLDNS